MSRLLFAAARGARIMSPNLEAPLSLIWINNTIDHGIDYYIHPEDEHLQYGPISTAVLEVEMRELMSSQFPVVAVHAAIACGIDSEWVVTWRTQGVGDRATALLILAEALADEGL